MTSCCEFHAVDVSGVFEAACHVRQLVAGHVLPVPNRPKETAMTEPIELDQIRVGDVVEQVQRTRMTVAEVCESRFASAGLYVEPTDDGCWDHTITTYELVSRPAPKPEVGQHWLDDKGAEHVVAGQAIPVFVSLATTQWIIRADVAPAGWTLKL